MDTKKLIGTGVIVLLVVAMSLGMAAAQGVLQSTDSAGATEVDNFIIGNGVYVRGITLIDCDGDNKVDVYVVMDSAKPEIWVDGEPITNAEHALVLVRTDVDPNDVNIGSNGPLFLGTVVDKTLGSVNGVNEIPAPYDFDIIFDCNQDGYFNATDDCVDYGICSGFRTDIPEFATIAIPAIALLGLVLYMRRKKE